MSLTRIAPRSSASAPSTSVQAAQLTTDVRAQVADRLVDRGGVGDVELGARQADDRVAAGGDRGDGVTAEHPAGAGDEDPQRGRLGGAALLRCTHGIVISELVADDHPQRLRHPVAARELDVAAEQARLHPGRQVADAGAREQDRVLDLGADDLDSGSIEV